MGTTIWLAVDIAAEGPDAVALLEKTMGETCQSEDQGVTRWRIINPANEADKTEFERVGKELSSTFESTEVEGQLELPFEN